MLKVLLQAGADPKAQDKDGNTLLHDAARSNVNPDVFKILLQAGADPKARNAAGETPWDLAQDNAAIIGFDIYWQLHDAQFE